MRVHASLATLLLFVAACGGGGGGGGAADGDDPTPTATLTAAATVTPTPTPSPTAIGPLAWAAGRQLLRSADGGFTWAPSEGLGSAVSFSDRAVGWVVAGLGSIMRTDDGGVTWSNQGQNIVDVPPILNDVAAIDDRRAVAVGFEPANVPAPSRLGPVALFTDDGGATWQRSVLPSFGAQPVDELKLWSVCATASGAGVATGSDVARPAGVLLITRDGGRSWRHAAGLSFNANGAVVACGPGDRLWLLGGHATIRLSEDGGTTWRDRSGGLSPSLRVRSGAFLPDGVGWIATSTSPSDAALRVFETRDGGVSWLLRLAVDARGELAWIAIDAVDDHRAVVVAGDVQTFGALFPSAGRSWVTIDAGATWTAGEHAGIDYFSDVELIP